MQYLTSYQPWFIWFAWNCFLLCVDFAIIIYFSTQEYKVCRSGIDSILNAVPDLSDLLLVWPMKDAHAYILFKMSPFELISKLTYTQHFAQLRSKLYPWSSTNSVSSDVTSSSSSWAVVFPTISNTWGRFGCCKYDLLCTSEFRAVYEWPLKYFEV